MPIKNLYSESNPNKTPINELVFAWESPVGQPLREE